MVSFSFSKKPFILALTILNFLINSLGANLNLVLQFWQFIIIILTISFKFKNFWAQLKYRVQFHVHINTPQVKNFYRYEILQETDIKKLWRYQVSQQIKTYHSPKKFNLRVDFKKKSIHLP
jgi:hypothetical protein